MPSQKQLPPLSVGDLIDSERLVIIQTIGDGAFGAVYAVKDVETGDLYAVKCLLPNRKSSRGPANVQVLFQHEYRQHSIASDHPNVLTLHRQFSEHGLHFFVFDICMGGDLLTHITNRPLFWLRDDLVKNAILQIIDGVAHCHSLGVAHRDLKPENVLVNEEVTSFFIADFGLATSRQTSTTHGVGSKYYKSPECALPGNAEYDTRTSDIWALGIILINIITGRVPWAQAHPDDDHYASFAKNKRSLLDYMPLSQELMPVLERVLEPRPEARISIQDLRNEISRVTHFYPTEDELAFAPELARSVMADRAAILNVTYALPPAVAKRAAPKPAATKNTQNRLFRPWRAVSPAAVEDDSPSNLQFAFATRPRTTGPSRATPLVRSQYLSFTIDAALRDNTARRLSLPRLAIACS